MWGGHQRERHRSLSAATRLQGRSHSERRGRPHGHPATSWGGDLLTVLRCSELWTSPPERDASARRRLGGAEVARRSRAMALVLRPTLGYE